MNELMKNCNNCKRYENNERAIYCFLCGRKLSDGQLRQYYMDLKIPTEKIEIEKIKKEKLSRHTPDSFLVFPFFLRKENDNYVKAIVIDELPKCTLLTTYKPALNPIADENKEVELTNEALNSFLNKGYKWYHVEEYTTMW